MYSLGSPKALTQFLYQRLSLPFFGDVGEQLPENTHTNYSIYTTLSTSLFLFQSCREKVWKNSLDEGSTKTVEMCNSLHDDIEVLRAHASLWVGQSTDDVRKQIVDCIVLMGNIIKNERPYQLFRFPQGVCICMCV